MATIGKNTHRRIAGSRRSSGSDIAMLFEGVLSFVACFSDLDKFQWDLTRLFLVDLKLITLTNEGDHALDCHNPFYPQLRASTDY